MPRSGRDLVEAVQALAQDLEQYVAECDEANDLLDLGDTEGIEIEWSPSSGESLRDALRKLKAKRARGE